MIFEYPKGSSKKNDLTVCFSRKNKQPALTTSEKVFHRPHLATLDTVDPFYLQPYLYIGLYSDFGCTLTLKSTFPKDDLKNYQLSSARGDDLATSSNDPSKVRSVGTNK